MTAKSEYESSEAIEAFKSMNCPFASCMLYPRDVLSFPNVNCMQPLMNEITMSGYVHAAMHVVIEDVHTGNRRWIKRLSNFILIFSVFFFDLTWVENKDWRFYQPHALRINSKANQAQCGPSARAKNHPELKRGPKRNNKPSNFRK